MSPIERACLYMVIFIIGIVVGACIHAIALGLQKAAYNIRMAETIATLFEDEDPDE